MRCEEICSYLQGIANEIRKPENIPPDELDEYLGEFLLSIRQNGPGYEPIEHEPITLQFIISSIQCYLTERRFGYSITLDVKFKKSQDVLKTKLKKPKSEGKH